MSVTQITTHNADALARLLYQYRNSSNLQGLLTGVFGTQTQELEDALYGILEALDIQSMEGDQLDQIGTIVGQERYGVDDVEYRVRILARIGKNVSEGDIERVISIWRLFSPESASIQLVENFPAEVAIYSDSSVGVGVPLLTEDEEPILTEDGLEIYGSFRLFGVGVELLDENEEALLEEDGTSILESFTSQVSNVLEFMQDVVAAGVKFGYVCVYDSINAFGFADSINASGFGDSTDTAIGGRFSYIEA